MSKEYERKQGILWRKLAKIEPRLLLVEKAIMEIRSDGIRFCANDVWYDKQLNLGDAFIHLPAGHGRGFKEIVVNLAGWYAEKTNPIIMTQEAYDCAYEHLYNLLPPCVDCNCL